jgi:hypothetical protein
MEHDCDPIVKLEFECTSPLMLLSTLVVRNYSTVPNQMGHT